MLKRSALVVALAMTTMTAAAQEEDRTRTYDELAPIAIKYAESLGCGGDGNLEALGKKNIARFDVLGTGTHETTYVTAVYSDFGCAGGSGTTLSHLVVLGVQQWRPSAPTYVLSELSEPNAEVIGAPGHITSIYVKNGKLHATSTEYGPDD